MAISSTSLDLIPFFSQIVGVFLLFFGPIFSSLTISNNSLPKFTPHHIVGESHYASSFMILMGTALTSNNPARKTLNKHIACNFIIQATVSNER